MEEISCIFCGERSQHLSISENGYTGLKCDKCNLIYISPRPNAAEVVQLYAHDHSLMYADAQFQFEQVMRMTAALALSKIRNYKQSGSILELGPGGGYFLLEARNNGYDPYGIELNPIEARWINEELRIPCENFPLREKSFGGKQFDIIYHKDVLSHLHDPIGVFRDINKALKEDGLLVFETGNIADVRKKYFKYFSQFSYPDHLFFYGEKSISTLLARTGFRCIGIIRSAILLQLILQKVLWRIKDSLKDKYAAEEMKSQREKDSAANTLTVKRRLRNLYRYTSYALVRFGTVLPKKGRPLKLLIFAQKESDRVES